MGRERSIILGKPIEPPVLLFDGGEEHDPILALEHHKLGPYRTPEKSSFRILVCIPYRCTKEEEDFISTLLSDIIEGLPMSEKYEEKAYRSRWWGFKEVFNVELDFELIRYPWEEKAVDKSINQLTYMIKEDHKSTKRALYIIYLPHRFKSSLRGPYYKIKGKLINDVRTQIIIGRTYEKYYRTRQDFKKNPFKNREYGDFLWNLSLSIFTKLGGIPWKLKSPIEGVLGFIGFASEFVPTSIGYERRAIVAVQLFNEWGEYEHSVTAKLSNVWKDEEKRPCFETDKVRDLVLSIADEIPIEDKEISDNYLICHITELYSDKVLNTIMKTLNSRGFEKVKLIRVQREGPLRIFDTSSEKPAYAWPTWGTYWFLESGKIAQLYSSGAWRYSPLPTSKPYTIHYFTSSPVQVVLEKPPNEQLTRNDLKNIAWLTNLHFYSADIHRIKLPADLRFARRLARISASMDEPIKELSDITYLY